MNQTPDVNLWTSTEHALDYLRHADTITHRVEGEAALLEFVPATARRILDLGSGAGRLISLVKTACPQAECIALDFSPAMLDALAKQFENDPRVRIVAHDLENALPALAPFDAVISSFAIHHLRHERKRSLYTEVFRLLSPGGVFCNLEHVASPTIELHHEFLTRIGFTPETEDPSNKLLNAETQLGWLREIGFTHVDCHWKWRELALMAGVKP